MPDLETERRALALFEAMLDIDESEREAWLEKETSGDFALKQRVTAIIEAERLLSLGTGAYIEAVETEPPPERIGAYRITDVIGSGGMGTVFAAERDEGDFDHSVAIKLIKPGIFTEQLVTRFNRERQILAGLNHPNITRLFDGGTTDNGQPYIVMERIDGVPLVDWLTGTKPDLETRLRLFLQVCSAAGHAHRNLVVHRDLTPANVLVDQDGDAKLIDFGIARPEGEAMMPMAGEGGENAPVRAVTMTPGYAAPERIAGDAATVLSDIYSAGKMLEALLPAGASDELKAIVTKAAADNPDDRYLSTDALADDIQAILDERPVGAVPDTAGYRFRKWTLRNRALAGVGAALAMALVVGSVATAWWWREAVVARDDANARFAEVRGIATFMLFDLYDELEPVSGNTKALSQIADEARAYLERLSAADDIGPELRLEIAQGYHRLSTVSGNPEGANLGRREDAKLFLDRALTDLETLNKAEPDNPAYIQALAEALYSQAIFKFIAEDDNEGAIAPADRSAELYKRLGQMQPEETSHRIAWYRSRVQAAKPYVWLEQGEEGAERLEKLIAEVERDPAVEAGEPKAMIALASANSELGYTRSWYIPADDPEYRSALPPMDRAYDIYFDLFENGPEELRDDLRLNMIAALFKRSLIYYDAMRLDEALEDLERAEGYANFIIARDPDDDGAKTRLDTVESQKIYVFLDLGRAGEAVETSQRLLSQRVARLQDDPENVGYFRDVVTMRQSLAEALTRAGNRSAGCREYRAVRLEWDALAEKSEISSIDQSNSIEPLTAALARC
ncbi:serine/threonine-protein kinase [uncultured Erythrobacter sp.]|uniref:serine/threonine-protein kinase n=1 Tax=uncultured Erythrobacter sp. TaxID=263913 RepID=UPI0026352242|nr:serine/threonine-protein kinase [uncultured Erythrobacter sp.]